MKWLEATTFAGIALAAHVAALGMATGGSAGGGASPAPPVVLDMRASSELAALAEQWETPPTEAEAPDAPELAEPDMAALPPPVIDSLPERPKTPQTTTAPPLETLPQLDHRLPAPPGIVQLAPAPLDSPTLTTPKALNMATPDTQLLSQRPPQLGSVALPQPPQLDTASAEPPAPTSPQAPAVSLRPTPRPADLAPPPTRRAERRTEQPPKPKPRATSSSRPAPSANSAPARAAPKPKAKPKPKPAGPSRAAIRSAQSQWIAQINRAAQRAKRTPRSNASGKVTVRFRLTPRGKLIGASVSRSSGNAALDKAALQTIQRARYPRAPKVLTDSAYTITVTLQFKR